MILAPLVLLFAAQQPRPLIRNAGFEASQPGEGWTASSPKDDLNVTLRGDPNSPREGKQSLRISARNPASYVLAQELFLVPGELWRASVWVKAGSSPAPPRLEIDTPVGGQGEASANPKTDQWQELKILFRVPSPGRVSMRLVAFSRSTGEVWFDDVRMSPVDEVSEAERITILADRIGRRPIDLKQGGQFIEPLCRLTSSMIAQQVDDTSFEEEPAWKPSYKREIDKPYRPWYPDGAVHLARYSFDTDRPFNGKRSQKIELPAAHTWAGISQDGFSIEPKHEYVLRLHMRGAGAVRVRASLRGDGGSIAPQADLGTAAKDWTGARAAFKTTRASSNATLTIELEGPGTLWLDRVYLIDTSAELGLWRPDVVAALKALNSGVIRFGGSTLEVFEWDKCLGDWDKRVPYETVPWGGLDPNFVGVEEFVQLTRHVGAEPLICVRWTGKTPKDAAAEVEYFNGAPNTTWGSVRARNGHPEPYDIKYWQIGNEIGGEKYDASVKAFAEAMRSVDPTIKVLSSFPSADTLRLGGGYLDYLCPHHYEVGDLVSEENSFRGLGDEISRYAGGKDVRIAVTEWNTTAGEMGLTRGILLTLGNALSCSRYQNLMHRYSDLVEIAIRSNLSDSFGSGIIQPGSGWLYKSPTYYSQWLYQRAAGSFPLRVERSSQLPIELREPDISVALSEDKQTLRIYAVNSTAKPEQTKIMLSAVGSVKSAKSFVLHDRDAASDSEAMNGHDDPDRIQIATSDEAIRGSEFDYVFQPFTVTLLELAVGP